MKDDEEVRDDKSDNIMYSYILTLADSEPKLLSEVMGHLHSRTHKLK